MRIIFINQVTGPLLIDIINSFCKKNIEIILYTGKVEKTYTDIDKSVRIKFLKKYNRSNSFFRIYTWLLFYIQTIFLLLFDLNTKTKLYLSSNPPFTPFINLFFKNKSVVHIYDVYPDALLASKSFNQKSLIYKFFSYLNKKSFEKTLHVYTPSEGMRAMLSKYVNKNKITVVNWWSDSHFIKPIKKCHNNFLKKLNIQEKFIVLYSGNFGFTHNIEKILNTSLFFKHEKDLVFVLIGDGPKKKIVDNFQKANKLKNLIVLPFQKSEVLPFSISCGDISVILDSFSATDKKISTASIPSKTYYYLSSGSAIYAETDKTSELSQLIQKNDIGLADQNNEITNFINYIKKCKKSEIVLNKYKKNSRILSENFTKKNAFLVRDLILNNFYENSSSK